MFGNRRRRAAAAAQAALEQDRRELFAQLALRPAHICPFLGLGYERTGYVEGPSIEHRCFAFGDPAPLSSQQQTQVCQERGHGQCPRYLRGLLVTPPEGLQALRDPKATVRRPPAPPSGADQTHDRGIGTAMLLVTVALVLLLVAAGVAYLLLIGV